MIAEVIDKVVATFAPVLGIRRAMARDAMAQLATYAAADRGRNNKDFRASAASADAAIIPDAAILNARARTICRDTWIGKSAIRSWSRNVVGCGIMPVPIAKDAKGNLLAALNKQILNLFSKWAQKKEWCDVEKRQSFWQKQNLCLEELVTVGEHFLIWSYTPNPDSVGLRLQSAEPEQLDNTILSFGTNEVRGGVEIDPDGAAVAYHFFTRNPTDYGSRRVFKSVRIEASRVIHVFKQERVQQTRGVTWLAPVLQDIRDYGKFKNATMWRAIMEMCIGAIFKKDNLTTPSGRPGFGAPTGDTGGTVSTTTPTGMRTIDWVPGMVIEGRVGESVEPFMPTTPGNAFEPFTKATQRGIGAGIGISHGQLSRQSEGNYSAARQDMLEDRKEYEPIQELVAHNCVLEIFALFVSFAVAEGRLDIPDFLDDPSRYTEAEYVAPAAPWIDPEKEMNAWEKAIELNLIDREEIIAVTAQKRRADVWDKIMEEQQDASSRGIALGEVTRAGAATLLAATPILDKLRQRQIGPVAATELLVIAGIDRGRAKKMVTETEALPPPVIQDVPEGGQPLIDAAPAPQKQGQQQNQNGNGQNGKNQRSQQVSNSAKGNGVHASRLAVIAGAPNYRASSESDISCSSCASFLDGTCNRYDFATDPGSVCDSFEVPTLAASAPTSHVPNSPRPEGDPGIDGRGGFEPAARQMAAKTEAAVEALKTWVLEQGKSIDRLAAAHQVPAAAPDINITIDNHPPKVDVAAPPPATVNVSVESPPAPEVTIENKIEVPAAAAPEIRIEVQPSPAPEVNIHPVIQIEPAPQLPPVVNVTVTPPPPVAMNRTIKIEKDKDGNPTGATIKEEKK